MVTALAYSQEKRITYSSSLQYLDEEKYPGAIVLIGNVNMQHEGATLDCQQALYYKSKNFFKAIGEVVMEQGDTIIQYSDYADYNGKTKQAISWGNVEVNDQTIKLTTDTLNFDRVNQRLYYKSGGTIKDKTNTLKSRRGTYLIKNKKFIAKSKVTVDNAENHLDSNHLEYYTNSGVAYLYGASTITNKKNNNKLYSERGFYDTKTDISYFVKNAKLFLKERTIEGDSLYYDKRKGFASASYNIKVIDTAQNFVAKGNYAELFEHKDSLFIVDRAVAISVLDKDSLYVHGDKILVTGKPENKIVRTFNNVKIFKSDLQGKCDSIHTNQKTGITKMYVNPVLWSNKSQIKGDSIYLTSNIKTEKLDSLKVFNNSLIVQQDSINKENFNQIKGRNMFGKFTENELRFFLVKGNSESIYYNNNEETGKLETITKEIASDIEFTLSNSEIETIKYIKRTEGKTHPPSMFPEKDRNLRGFIWREDERPKKMEDIFIKEKKPVKKPKKQNKEVQKAKARFKKEVNNKRSEFNEMIIPKKGGATTGKSSGGLKKGM